MGGGECIAPHILNLGTRQRWVVSFTPWLLHPWSKSPPPTHWTRGWAGPRASLDVASKRKKNPIIAPARNWTLVVQPVA